MSCDPINVVVGSPANITVQMGVEQGFPGPPGATWRTGSGAPSDSIGKDGDLYLDTATSNVWLRTSGVYSIIANIKGEAATWRSGAGAPSNSLGVDGDLYLDTVTSNVWQRASGVYAIIANIKGEQGEPGPAATTYIYTQSSPAATWNVTHDMNKFPSVSILDSTGDEVEGNVVYLDSNNLVLTFSAAFSGVAYLN